MASSLLLDHRVDGHRDVRLERIGFLERVGVKEEHRIAFERRHVGTEIGHCHHVRRVLDEDAGVAMIGVVIVGPMTHDDVGIPFPDQAGDSAAILQGRQQLAVVNVQDFRGDAQEACGGLDLGLAAARQGAAGVAPVADVAVGHGDELDVVPLRPPQDGDAAGLQFAIVRMGPETEDAQLAVVRRRCRSSSRFRFRLRLGARGPGPEQPQHDQARHPTYHPKSPESHGTISFWIATQGACRVAHKHMPGPGFEQSDILAAAVIRSRRRDGPVPEPHTTLSRFRTGALCTGTLPGRRCFIASHCHITG